MVDLYKNKYKINYLSFYLGNQSTAFNVTILIQILIALSQIVYLAIVLFQSSKTRQRLNVPELNREKWKIYIILVSALISITSILGMTFFYKESAEITKRLGLVDNILLFLYTNSSFLYSAVSFTLLSNIETTEIFKNYNYIFTKQILVYIMGIQVLCCIML